MTTHGPYRGGSSAEYKPIRNKILTLLPPPHPTPNARELSLSLSLSLSLTLFTCRRKKTLPVLSLLELLSLSSGGCAGRNEIMYSPYQHARSLSLSLPSLSLSLSFPSLSPSLSPSPSLSLSRSLAHSTALSLGNLFRVKIIWPVISVLRQKIDLIHASKKEKRKEAESFADLGQFGNISLSLSLSQRQPWCLYWLCFADLLSTPHSDRPRR